MKLFALLALISVAAVAGTTTGSSGGATTADSSGGGSGSSDDLKDGEMECECDTEEDVCDDDDKDCSPYLGAALCGVRSSHPKAKKEDGKVTNVCKWNQECKVVKANAALNRCIKKKNNLCVKFQFLGGWGSPEETGANGKAVSAKECDVSETCCDGQCCRANEYCQQRMASVSSASLDFEYDFTTYNFEDIMRNDGKLPDGKVPLNLPRKCVPRPQAVTWISGGLLPIFLIGYMICSTMVMACVGRCGWEGACCGKLLWLLKSVPALVLTFACVMLFFSFSWFYALVSFVLAQIASAALAPNQNNNMEQIGKKLKWVLIAEVIWVMYLIGGIYVIPIGGYVKWFALDVGFNMFAVFISGNGDIATLQGYCTKYFHGYNDFTGSDATVNKPLWYKGLGHASGRGHHLCLEEWLTFCLVMYLLVILFFVFKVQMHALGLVRFDKTANSMKMCGKKKEATVKPEPEAKADEENPKEDEAILLN